MLKDIIILGFTVPEIDSLLEYYADKTYNKIFNQEYEEIFNNEMKIIEIESRYENIDHNSKEYEIKVENAKTKAIKLAKEKAFTKTQRECEQGVQGIEYKLNTARVHKLVANHFLKREMGKNIVNHKDGNKLNNCVDNLEFVTLSENTLHAIYTLKKDFTKTKLEKKQPIISIENNEIYRFFESISKAVKFYNISSRTIGRKLNNPKNDLYFIRFSDLNDDNINKIVNKQDILDIKYNIKRRNK